jgi:hypothetical protein
VLASRDCTLNTDFMLQVFNLFHLYAPPFCVRFFNAFDTDWDGELDFTEFIGAMFAFCGADRLGLETLAFDLYDDGKQP